MEYFNTLLRKEKQHEMVLLVVLVIYIMFDISTPTMLAEYVDTVYGNIAVRHITNPIIVSALATSSIGSGANTDRMTSIAVLQPIRITVE